MIPKIIHYCWFGKKDKPSLVNKYIESWRNIMPDFQLLEWNECNFDVAKYRYTKEAYKAKKYAFVSDVARLYALYDIGGVYFDTDILLLKSMDNLLTNKSFVGYESDNLLGTGVMAAEKNTQWIYDFYQLYQGISFINWNGRQSLMPNTVRLQRSNILKDCKFDGKEDVLENGLHIYPFDYFCAKDYNSSNIQTTNNTYCIHDYSSSWIGEKDIDLRKRIINLYCKF